MIAIAMHQSQGSWLELAVLYLLPRITNCPEILSIVVLPGGTETFSHTGSYSVCVFRAVCLPRSVPHLPTITFYITKHEREF